MISSKKLPPFVLFIVSMAVVIFSSNILVLYHFPYFAVGNFLANLTWGAFTYPICFLVTDLANITLGTNRAKLVVYAGFIFAVLSTLVTGLIFYENFITFFRIAIASGTAFLTAQLLDVYIFDKLRRNVWYVPPVISSTIGSFIDTFLFFIIAFFATGLPWMDMARDDFSIKIIYCFLLLIPYNLLRRRLIF